VKTILLIEDDPIMGESLQQRFELEGYAVNWCRRLSDAQKALNPSFIAIVSDVRLPDGLSTAWYVELPAAVRTLPWYFLTGYGSVNDAVNAMRAGARQYLTKPFDIEHLVSLIQELAAPSENVPDEVVLGVSPPMRKVEEMIHKVAKQKVSVLLSGESGVGKEVAAQLIHKLDPRADKGEFIAVNCAAIPETMLEAEFFGYEKGAFSGAVRMHHGYLERADKGTLFLDEVGELPASMQAKLLRALQEKCFFRLGSEKTFKSDFRIVAATNRDLYADMKSGKFREDLFYRLAVIKIQLLPLRDRPEDIRWLTEQFLAVMALEHSLPIAISENFLRDVLSRDWRGNVRELRSYLEQAVVLSEAGILDVPLIENSQQEVQDDSMEILPLHLLVEDTERKHIRRALHHCQGSISKTAELLGINRKTLWEKMKRLDLSV
jgi:DNA-binding NtrC family response regulator